MASVKQQTKSGRELFELEISLYRRCYIGHLPSDWWKKLAKYVLRYGRKQYRKGLADGYKKGLQKGQEDGLTEGYREGLHEGMEYGYGDN